MTQYSAVILDCETTGLKAPEVVEVGYIPMIDLHKYEDNQLITAKHTVYQERFKPSKPIEAGATAIHGIYFKDVVGCKPFSFPELNLPKTVNFIIGHNISFDHRAMGKPELPVKYICTLKLAKLLWPGLKSYKLTSLMEEHFPEFYNSLIENAHGALIDCKLVLLLLYQAVQTFEINSWEDLHELAGYYPE